MSEHLIVDLSKSPNTKEWWDQKYDEFFFSKEIFDLRCARLYKKRFNIYILCSVLLLAIPMIGHQFKFYDDIFFFYKLGEVFSIVAILTAALFLKIWREDPPLTETEREFEGLDGTEFKPINETSHIAIKAISDNNPEVRIYVHQVLNMGRCINGLELMAIESSENRRMEYKYIESQHKEDKRAMEE